MKLTAAVSVGTEFVHHPGMDAQDTVILEDKLLTTNATPVSFLTFKEVPGGRVVRAGVSMIGHGVERSHGWPSG